MILLNFCQFSFNQKAKEVLSSVTSFIWCSPKAITYPSAKSHWIRLQSSTFDRNWNTP